MRRSSCFGDGYYPTIWRRVMNIPTIEPQHRVVSYVEKAEKSQSLHWFMIGLALYVSYSLGCAVSKPEILISDYGTVMVDGKVAARCSVVSDDVKCERYSYQQR
jgi:hypothetical protein